MGIGTANNTPATSRLEVYGSFRTTMGKFSSIYSENTDGLYPTTYSNTSGDSQLSIGANWTGGQSEVSLINSNISGGGLSFWQMTGTNSKRILTFMRGDGNVGIGTIDPVSKLHIKGGGLTLGSNVMSTNTDGFVSLGDLNTNSSPTPQDWTAKTSLLLNALDYSTIGFHDSGSRVDFIRSGGGKIDLGYDGGWGRAHVGFANGIWDANGKVGIGTLTPTALLHVNGNYRSEGSFSQGWPGTFAVDATGVIGGRFVILDNGNVGIGTPAPGNYKLAVEGKIGAREVEVKTGSWADFVFQPGYRLRPLSEVERYLQTYKHLPEIPSEAEVKTNGINLGEMDAKLLQKIEELTLYSIQLEKSMQVQEQKHQQDLLRLQQVQQTEIDELKRLVKQLLDKK